MDGNSLNVTQDLIEQLKALVPQAFSEDKLDIQKLQTLLGQSVHTDQERYQLSWAGKSEAYKVLQTPTTATLIPQQDQSVNWEETENVFIEGENLEVLKVLQKSYYGKIKMIYIDPPYNTGSDSFIYPDKFSETKEEYLRRIGEKDDEGYLMKEGLFRKNSKENGQFHSNWLNMMLPRLFLARNLLKEDGVIFVSIDDNEQANLKLLMDEIFGEENFLGTIIWKKKTNGNNMGYIPPVHDYLVSYSKNKAILEESNFGFPISNEYIKKFYSNPDNDPRGLWNTMDLSANHKGPYFEITNPNTGEKHLPSKGRYWVFNEDEVKRRINDGRIIFGKSGTGKPVQKVFLNEKAEKRTKAESWWDKHGMNKDGTLELTELFGIAKIFDHSKPSTLIENLVNISTESNSFDIILDFFAGSGATFHGVTNQNRIDAGNRKVICIQLPEKTEFGSVALENGFHTISDISTTRIKKVIEKIEAERKGKIAFESPQPLGFRKYTLAPSNFKIWRGDMVENKEELETQMALFVTPEKEGAQAENLLWELLIKNGVSLTGQIQKISTADGASIYHTQDKRFAFVLDKYTPEAQAKILELQPKTLICLDSLFHHQDKVKTNAQLKMEDNGITFKTV